MGMTKRVSKPNRLLLVPCPEIQKLLWDNLDTEVARLELGIEHYKSTLNRDDATHIFLGKLERICLSMSQEDHYRKYISADSIAILGGKHVDDRFFYAAQEMVLAMTSKRPELREQLWETTRRNRERKQKE